MGAPVAEHTVVVVGSNQPFPEYTPGNFWVIDFSDAAAPTAVSVGCPSTGVVLDCAGSLAAVAACAGDSVTIYDISNPGSPKATGSASLSFNGIGAISFYGGYVLAGEASNNLGARVALIDINNLASPQVYSTTFAQITDVTLFGSTAVICGLGGYSNAFQVAKTSDFAALATSVPRTDVSAWSAIPFVCDFDGTNAVFSDGTSLYAYGISNGTATLIGSGSGGGGATSVAIAENGGADAGAPLGGIQLAYTAVDDSNVELQYVAPPVPPGTNWSGSSASLGDPSNIYGQPINFEGGVAKFYRTIYGSSAVLAAAGVTQVAGGGTQECVVTLFDVKVSGGIDQGDPARQAFSRRAAEYDVAEQHARRHRLLHVVADMASVDDPRFAVGAVVRGLVNRGGEMGKYSEYEYGNPDALPFRESSVSPVATNRPPIRARCLRLNRHCEERSDEAISERRTLYDPWIASLRSQYGHGSSQMQSALGEIYRAPGR